MGEDQESIDRVVLKEYTDLRHVLIEVLMEL